MTACAVNICVYVSERWNATHSHSQSTRHHCTLFYIDSSIKISSIWQLMLQCWTEHARDAPRHQTQPAAWRATSSWWMTSFKHHHHHHQQKQKQLDHQHYHQHWQTDRQTDGQIWISSWINHNFYYYTVQLATLDNMVRGAACSSSSTQYVQRVSGGSCRWMQFHCVPIQRAVECLIE